MDRVKLSTIVLASVVLGSVVSCSSPPPTEPAAPPPPNQVNVGDTVTWVFADGGMAHDVVADDKSFRSPLLKSGTFSYTFDEPGTFSYHCTPHPDMTGSVTVVP